MVPVHLLADLIAKWRAEAAELDRHEFDASYVAECADELAALIAALPSQEVRQADTVARVLADMDEWLGNDDPDAIDHIVAWRDALARVHGAHVIVAPQDDPPQGTTT